MLIYFLLTLIILYGLILSRLTVIRDINWDTNEVFVARNKITLFFWFAILLGLAVFKGIEVGVDYPMYYDFFLRENYSEMLEPGVSFIYDLAVKYDSFYIFSFIVYSLFIFFVFYGIKKNSPNYLISILLFVIMHIYFNGYNQVRQLIAVSMLFCFADYLITDKSRDRVKYVLVILIALLFHNSAIFLLVLFLIPKRKFNPKVVIPLFLMTCILYFLPSIKNQVGELISFISGVYGEKYPEGGYNFFGVNKEKGIIQFIPVVVQMVIVVISLYIPKPNQNLNVSYKLYNFSTNVVIVYLCFYAFAGIEAFDRLQIYFSCFNIYFYSYLIHLLLNDKKKLSSQLFVIIIILFWFLYYILRLTINVHGVVPYYFIS